MTLALILIGLIALLLTGIPIFAGLGLISIGLLIFNEGQISSVGDIVLAALIFICWSRSPCLPLWLMS